MRDLFRRAGLDTPELDARLLAEQAFALDRLELINLERADAPAEPLARLREMAERRLRGEPIARIFGEKDFFGLSFALNAATLVPRPETELLVVRTLAQLEGRHHKRILDLGTGTGCIAISVLTQSPSATAVAVDLSEEALEMARQNAGRHGVTKRFEARRGSWFDPLQVGEDFDVVVSNPPYIEHDAIAMLPTEVRDHDPRAALDGGEDGLDGYRTILGEAPHWLRPGGAVVVEIGAAQGPAVSALFRAEGFADVTLEKDLAGLDRVVFGHHN